jgi:iron complex outermembrane recepter protein
LGSQNAGLWNRNRELLRCGIEVANKPTDGIPPECPNHRFYKGKHVKIKKLAYCVGLAVGATVATGAWAQTTTNEPVKVERVEVTGSNIKRVQTEGALPVQTISREQLDRSGTATVEQLITQLTSNGNGFDNLASTSDVVGGANRGNNGLSAANLRSQGSNATLILLNGRRIAAHGLNGGTVDLKQIPLAAVARVEVLKDGASAIYGTDAIGGVINFILRKDYVGLSASASVDVTQDGGGNIYRGSLLGGWGDVEKDGFNAMASISYSKNDRLLGTDRDFINTFQPDRGLSVDTRGTPYATVFAIAQARSILSSRNAAGALGNATAPTQPGTTQSMNGINVLDLPGQAGCASIPGQQAYDERLWASPNAKWGCAWDTGKAATIQQPVENITGTARAVFKITPTLNLFAEGTASEAKTKKSFSNVQVTSNNFQIRNLGLLALYPSTGSAYNEVFNAIAAVFPTIEENRGQSIAFRWRCMECGPRQIATDSKTGRFLVGGEGNFGEFDYKFGAWSAFSDTKSTLGSGYYFIDKFVPLINNGTLNPFLKPGQTQSQAALDGLAAASAAGTKLFGGKFTTSAVDAAVSGPVFKLPAGDLMVAVGADFRTEKYTFNGSQTDLATQVKILAAPFDSSNELSGVKRDVTAAYLEAAVPVIKGLEVSAAFRHDRYTGFGGVTNPKFSIRFNPVKEVLFRGSYSEGFRVPTFSQQFFGVTEESYSGKDLVDPAKCATGIVDSTKPGCEAITPNIFTGGKLTLQPETSKSTTFGIVFEPMPWFNGSVDYWEISRKNQIASLDLTTLVKNYQLFPGNFIRDAAGTLTGIDQRWVNAGETRTKGIDVSLRGNTAVYNGKLSATLDGTYMVERKYRLLPTSQFGDNQVGKYTTDGDIPIRWKHTLAFTYAQGAWAGTVSNYYTMGYLDRVAPGIANGTVTPSNYNPDVKAYSTYNLSATYSGMKNAQVSFGVKNILNTDPPFSAAYDADLGAGSSWEPRLADPRGRSFWANLTYNFK